MVNDEQLSIKTQGPKKVKKVADFYKMLYNNIKS